MKVFTKLKTFIIDLKLNYDISFLKNLRFFVSLDSRKIVKITDDFKHKSIVSKNRTSTLSRDHSSK